MAYVKKFRVSLRAASALFFAGCASLPGPGPREEDRPYLVSADTAAWRTTLSWGSAPESSVAAFPWEWEQRIGNWSLVWKPIPFEARFMAHLEPQRMIGLRFNILGEPYYRSGDFNWSPFVEVEWRERLTLDRGLRTVLLLNPEIRRSGDPFNLTAELRSGPSFQLGAWLWLHPHMAIRPEVGSPIARYLGTPPPQTAGAPGSLNWRWRFPIGAEARIRLPDLLGLGGLSQGWLGVDATWYHLGYGDHSSVQILSTLSWSFGT